MIIKGQVLNASTEKKDLVGKDGIKNTKILSHVLLAVGKIGDTSYEIVNLRCYDAAWDLPKIGEVWESPRVKKYENYDGQVAEVMV